MKELVSVIIPTYKRSYTMLIKAIDSVLNQTYQNFEILIIDDNSNDTGYSIEIKCQLQKKNDNRIRYIKHENNKGACAARNTGIKHSQGNYIGFLDDDDEWLPEKLEYQMEKFDNNEVGLVYCDSYSIRIKNKKEINRKIRSFRISGNVYDQLMENNFVGSTSFVLLKKEALSACGYFNQEMESAQDFELWLRISQKYKIDYVDVPLVNYYAHDGERISTNNNSKIQGLTELNKLNINYLKNNKKKFGLRKSKIVPFYYKRDGYKKALLKFLDAFVTYPFNPHVFKVFIKITLDKLKISNKRNL